MGKATTKSGNLQRALEARRRANAEREARERAIVQSLKEFLDELDKLEHAEQSAAKDEAAARARAEEQIARIERELNERLERIRQSAQATTIRRTAGAAAQVMRTNGETIASIAAQSGQTQTQVRELLRLADTEQHDAGEQTPQDAHAENSATVPNGGADTPASLSEAAQMSEGVAAVDDPATEALSA